MGPVLALKYFRYTYRPSAINILQKAERSRGPMYTLVNLESQLRSEKDNMVSSSTMPVKNKSSVYEPLLSDSPMASRRSLAPSSFDIFQPAHSRTSHPRNIKANQFLFFVFPPPDHSLLLTVYQNDKANSCQLNQLLYSSAHVSRYCPKR